MIFQLEAIKLNLIGYKHENMNLIIGGNFPGMAVFSETILRGVLFQGEIVRGIIFQGIAIWG